MNASEPPPAIRVDRLGGRTFRCQARDHEIVTDRSLAEGGADRGPTSGELLLMAIGSCAAGSVRRFLAERGAAEDFSVGVTLGAESVGGSRPVRISLRLPADLTPADIEAARRAALCGGVVSRIALGSKIEVVVAPAAP